MQAGMIYGRLEHIESLIDKFPEGQLCVFSERTSGRLCLIYYSRLF